MSGDICVKTVQRLLLTITLICFLIRFEMNKFIWFILPTIIISKAFLSQILAEATDTLFHISWDNAALKPFITETFFFK